jgi:hypothetical protein
LSGSFGEIAITEGGFLVKSFEAGQFFKIFYARQVKKQIDLDLNQHHQRRLSIGFTPVV